MIRSGHLVTQKAQDEKGQPEATHNEPQMTKEERNTGPTVVTVLTEISCRQTTHTHSNQSPYTSLTVPYE